MRVDYTAIYTHFRPMQQLTTLDDAIARKRVCIWLLSRAASPKNFLQRVARIGKCSEIVRRAVIEIAHALDLLPLQVSLLSVRD